MNASSSWGNSSGFANPGNTSSKSQSSPFSGFTGGSLAPSNSNSTFQFGSTPASAPSTSNSLFGNKSAGTNFGAQGASSTPSTFRENSVGPAATSGSNGTTFGSTNGQGGGLFGGTTTNKPGVNSSQGGNMFGLTNNGNNAPKGQLFGNLNANGTPGLFGNSNSGAAPTGGGISVANPPKGGLFGNSQQSLQSGNAPASLFGSSTSQGGGGLGLSTNLFGNLLGASGNQPSSSVGTSNPSMNNFHGGISSLRNDSNSVNSTNPYGQNLVLTNIAKTEQSMPPSITSPLLKKQTPDKKQSIRSSLSSTVHGVSKPSMMSRLARTFKIFRKTDNLNLPSNIAKFKGLFDQQNRVDDKLTAEVSTPNRQKMESTPYSLPNNLKALGDYRKLVIKSNPSKFHLIDTDQIFKAKRRRININTPISSQYDENKGIDKESKTVNNSNVSNLSTVQRISTVVAPKSKDCATDESKDSKELNMNYFCTPSLEDLSLLSPLELTKVENFIVGRVGHGQISYTYAVDLSKLFDRCEYDVEMVGKELFGRIIKIENSIVQVYGINDYPSPELGNELNVPATITLNAPPRGCSIEEHIKLLQNMTGMEFVTYDPITFNWTFTVKHFSVWGLLDDSETEGDESEELARLRSLKKKQDLAEQEASIVYSRLYQNESYRNELKRQKLESRAVGIPGGWENETSRNTSVLDVKRNAVKDEINHEVNAFKERKFAHALAANASDITNDSDDEFSRGKAEGNLLEYAHFPRGAGNYDYLKHIVNNTSPDFDFGDIINEKAYEPEIDDEAMFDDINQETSFATCKNWVLQLELANGVDSAFATIPSPSKNQPISSLVNDILFDGVSFNSDSSQSTSKAKKDLQTPQLLLQESASPSRILLSASFQNLITRSFIEKRCNGFPHARFPEFSSFSNLSSIFSDDPSHEILKLVSILFDKPQLNVKHQDVSATDITVIKKLEVLEQKEAFASWLRSYNRQVFSHDKLYGNDKLFQAICLGDIRSAVDFATRSKNLHLASILTLLDSNDHTIKSIAYSQIESWDELQESNYISETTKNIFKLLAGKISEFNSDLPNSILIGLHVVYGSPNASIETSFEALPPRSEVCPLMDMLKVYSAWRKGQTGELGEIIKRSSLSNLIKWLLIQILEPKESEKTFSQYKNHVGLSLGQELEKARLWKEAIYAYSTMADDSIVKDKIREVITDYVAEIVEAKAMQEDYLVNVLKIPRTLLFEAYAIFNRGMKDMWGCAEALVVAELWDEVHDLICDDLGPSAVIEEDPALVSRLRSIISCFPEEGSIIPKWNQGAGFYAKYFDTIEANDNLDAIEDAEIVFLLDNAANFRRSKSFKVAVAMKIMSRKIGDLALDHQNNIRNLRPKILALCLGENESTYFTSRLLFEDIITQA